MKIGIVWLPNVGKSTLFNALTKSYSASAENFPFCTIDPNIGIVEVRDERLTVLSEMSQTKKTIYPAIKFVDIAWLVKWASKGEGMWNAFLSHIRETDAIVQVLRYFKDVDINHVEWEVDPLRDEDIITSELIFSDMEQIEKKRWQLQRKAKSWDKEAIVELWLLNRAWELLENGKVVYDLMDELKEDEVKLLKGYNFLTFKPFVFAINVGETDLWNADAIKREFEEKLQRPVAVVCAKMESDMMEVDGEERAMLLEEYGDVPTLDDLISLAYDAVGLMYYFTTGEKETRAWAIKKESTAPQAAGAIHGDFERWFIKAEVVAFDDLVVAGSWNKAKEAWKLGLQWKDYIVQDGDVMVFKFNV